MNDAPLHPCVLVDGVGRTRRRHVRVDRFGAPEPSLRVQRDPLTIMESALGRSGIQPPAFAEFRALERRLPDGSFIFGFDFGDLPGFQVWSFERHFQDTVEAASVVEDEFSRMFASLPIAAPVVTLHDTISPLPGQPGVLIREVIGVARTLSEPTT